MPELTIGAIAVAPVIAALVEAAKAAGLPSRWAPLMNAVLSVAAYLMVTQVLASKPEAVQAAAIALNVVIIFLTTAGFYTTAKYAATSRAREG